MAVSCGLPSKTSSIGHIDQLVKGGFQQVRGRAVAADNPPVAVCHQDGILNGIKNAFPFAFSALEDFFQVVALGIFLDQLALADGKAVR